MITLKDQKHTHISEPDMRWYVNVLMSAAYERDGLDSVLRWRPLLRRRFRRIHKMRSTCQTCYDLFDRIYNPPKDGSEDYESCR